MVQSKKKIIIYLYNRLFDPVIQSNIYLYIRDIASTPGQPYQFALVTYEDPAMPATKEQLQVTQAFFKQHDVEWYQLNWHKGTSLKQKALDINSGFWALLKLRLKGYKYLVTLASIAGAYGYLYSLVCRFKLYLYQYEPHSEFATESKLWSKDSYQYKISKYLEIKSARYAHVISTGTDAMIAWLRLNRARAKVFKITSVVNEELFVYDAEAGKTIREELQINPDTDVIVYPGKFGDLYYGLEIIELFVFLKERLKNVFFLILSPTDKNQIESWINGRLTVTKDYVIREIPYTKMPAHLSASDF